MKAPHRIVVGVSALVWYAGGVSLLVKGATLILEAAEHGAPVTGTVGAAVSGVFAGLVKSRFLFVKACRKNIKRIHAITAPYVWQCFRPAFFVMLALMITAGAWMSRAAHGEPVWLCAVGALDLSISIALLSSSAVFWTSGALKTSPANR